jgi:hypothetical protein
MNRRVLLPSILLYGGLVALDLACHALSPYPEVYDQQYPTGSAESPPATGGAAATEDAATEDAAFEDSLAVEDASDTGTTTAPKCPGTATVFANAANPQTITLDGTNAYWTNGLASGGSVGYLARTSTSGTANTLVPGLMDPLFIANAAGYVGWSALGTVGLVSVAGGAGSASTPGTSLTTAAGVAVDSTNLYWVSGSNGIIVQSAPVGGGGTNALGTAPGDYSARGLSVFGANLYFAGSASTGGGGAIFMVGTGGGGAPTALKTFATGSPSDVATDATNVYWTDLTMGGGSVLSMPLGGGGVTTMASSLGMPNHLAVDSTNVYTADSTGGSVYEIPIGTSGATGGTGGTVKVLAKGTLPIGVAADDGQSVVYFTSASAICTVPK